MKTRSNKDIGAILFVDVSGSMAGTEHSTRDAVSQIIRDTEERGGVVSMYASNHELRQHFFNNNKTFPKRLEYGGLSSVYDNFVRCVHEHLAYDSDITYDIYVFSDLDDNNSAISKDDFRAFMNRVNLFWTVRFIKK